MGESSLDKFSITNTDKLKVTITNKHNILCILSHNLITNNVKIEHCVQSILLKIKGFIKYGIEEFDRDERYLTTIKSNLFLTRLAYVIKSNNMDITSIFEPSIIITGIYCKED